MRRFDKARWRQIDALLDAALERPESERRAFVEERAAGDAELVREVLALLDSERNARAAIGEHAAELADGLDLAEPAESSAPDAPDRVGPYRIVREIGRGGMGVVYLAERDDDEFRRRVALKLVKRGVDTDEVVQRFRHERQILAALEHPEIARLYDGGIAEDGRPYLVMEHVEGRPIDVACDERRLDVRARIGLFLSVCRAVQYAHQKLVIHRDLKPSNILVAPDGSVKLLDFGIAKLLADADDAGTPRTRTGVRVMTPRYASPEQIRGDAVTTASDVYSLGGSRRRRARRSGGRPAAAGPNSPARTAVLWRRPGRARSNGSVASYAATSTGSCSRRWRRIRRTGTPRSSGSRPTCAATCGASRCPRGGRASRTAARSSCGDTPAEWPPPR